MQKMRQRTARRRAAAGSAARAARAAAAVLLGGLAAFAAAAAAPRAARAQSGSLATTFAGAHGQHGTMFDLTASRDLTVTGFAVHTATANDYRIRVYWKVGSYAGFESQNGAWTLLGQQHVTGLGQGAETAVGVGGLGLLAGQTYGLYVVNGDSVDAKSGRENLIHSDTLEAFANADLSLTPGVGVDFGTNGFNGSTVSPRTWNGRVHYESGLGRATTLAVAVPEPGTAALLAPAGFAALLGASASAAARRRRRAGS